MMKRTVYILLLAMGMLTLAPVAAVLDNSNSVAVLCAADNKAKEKAKAQKEKEKQKAQAQKAKEKAKAQKEKDKQKAQAQKAREKEKAQQAKAKQQAQAQKAKEKQKAQQAKAKADAKSASAKQTATKSEPQLTAAEEKEQYMKRVAAIDRSNTRAERYNNRDISHRLGFWGQVGYSNLFTSGIRFDKTADTGFSNTDGGFVGGGAGLGYQLRYRQMLMTVGAEFQTYNSVMGISNRPDGTVVRSYGMQPYADLMTYTYTFTGMQDHLIGGFVQLPVLFGMELRAVPLFWQAGFKAGIGMLGRSTLTGTFSTTITDKELINPMEDMYSHMLVTDRPIDRPATDVAFGLNLAATAEVGVNFDQWLKSAAHLRASLFVDYGLISVQSNRPVAGAQDLPVQMLVSANPLDFPVNSALATTSAANASVNPFLVGAKIAMWFELPRHEKPIQEYPQKPVPRMGVYLYDDEAQAPLGGVAVEITNLETGKQLRKNTNRQGQLQGRFAAGQYRIAATKSGYYPSDTVLHAVEEFSFDTLRVPLRRIPAPVVYTLCMNIYDAETREPIEAAARITTLTDTVALYAGQSADDGFIETPITAQGDYMVRLTAQGYMPKEDTVQFVRDTLDLYMMHIREGIKVKIENLFFATNKTVILPQSEQSMSDLAQFLLENPGVTIHIVGHTDAVGTDAANQILSEGRANAVRQNLIDRGVAPERMTAEGRGESEPVADNDTEEGRQLNRRVEFTITGTSGADIQQIY